MMWGLRKKVTNVSAKPRMICLVEVVRAVRSDEGFGSIRRCQRNTRAKKIERERNVIDQADATVSKVFSRYPASMTSPP